MKNIDILKKSLQLVDVDCFNISICMYEVVPSDHKLYS